MRLDFLRLIVGITFVAVAAGCTSPAPTPTAAPTLAEDFIVGTGPTMTPPAVAMASLSGFVPSDPALFGVTGRPQIVMLYAANCVSCDLIRPLLFEQQDKFGQFVDFLYIDTASEASKALQARLTATAPALIFFDPDNKEVGRMTDMTQRAEFQKLLEGVLTVG